jgi:hypothetical protein
MENTLFYTFSTISQTLAGAIGLLAAFLVYYLIQLDRSLREHLEFLLSRFPRCENTGDVHIMWETYDLPGLLQYFDEDKLRQLDGGDGLDKPLHLTPARRLFQKRNTVVSHARTALLWTGAVILFSLIVLSLTSLVVRCGYSLIWFIIALGVIAAGCCLGFYTRIVLDVIKP